MFVWVIYSGLWNNLLSAHWEKFEFKHILLLIIDEIKIIRSSMCNEKMKFEIILLFIQKQDNKMSTTMLLISNFPFCELDRGDIFKHVPL